VEYIQAHQSFLDAYPDFRKGVNFSCDFEEATVAWCMSRYSKGVQHCVALEHARQAIIDPSRLCPDCGDAIVSRAWHQ
jgi:hypothetical protein